MRLHADRVDDRVRAAPLGEVADHVADLALVEVTDVDGLDSEAAHSSEPLGDEVDGDHFVTAVRGDPAGHVADRSDAQHGHRAAGRDGGVLNRLPRRGQHVGQVEEAVVGRALGHLDRVVVGATDAEVLRLRAGHGAVELGVAVERGTHPLFADLGGLALRLQAEVAHLAGAAGDLEGYDDPVTDLEVDRRADVLDDADGLVPEDVAGRQERPEHLVEVQVGTADRSRRDPDDGVRRLLDDRFGDGVDPHVAGAVPRERSHGAPVPDSAPRQTGPAAVSPAWRPTTRGTAPTCPEKTMA